MERNSENRSSNGNNRNRRQNDRYNDFNQSFSDQSRNQNWDSDENQWDRESRHRNRLQDNYYDRPGSRLESMGALGNDWTRGRENDDNRNRFSDSGSWNDDQYDYRRRSQGYGNSGNNNSRNWWDKTKDEVSGWFGDENAQNRRDRDQQNDHRGKGPKGYVRTDERIREDVHERLTDDGTVDASEIEVDVRNGEVFLKGTVKSRNEKRRAEDIVENVSGVKNVENHVKVQQDNAQTGYSRSSGQYENKNSGFGSGSGSKTTVGAEYNETN